MVHNLQLTAKYPNYHLWATANRMNVMTNGRPIKAGDTVLLGNREYEVDTLFPDHHDEYEIVGGIKTPLESFNRKTEDNISNWIVENKELAFVDNNTKYYEFTFKD